MLTSLKTDDRVVIVAEGWWKGMKGTVESTFENSVYIKVDAKFGGYTIVMSTFAINKLKKPSVKKKAKKK
jgi:preprotein translocase subunit YajC